MLLQSSETMPRLKRQKWRAEQAAIMRAIKRSKTMTQSEELSLTDSSNTIINNTNKYMKQKLGNLQLTNFKTNTKGDIHKLGMGAREYKGQDEYIQKDSENRLLHWDSLKNLICSNVQCSKCGSEVTLHENTIGIATQVGLTCKNQRCNLKQQNKVKRTKFRKYNFRTDLNESFAINCQLVLSMLQMECGSTEAGVLLTFLVLPNAHAFHRMSFSRI